MLQLSACIEPDRSSPHEVASLRREILLQRSLRRDARPAIGKNRGNNHLIAIGVVVPKLYVAAEFSFRNLHELSETPLVSPQRKPHVHYSAFWSHCDGAVRGANRPNLNTDCHWVRGRGQRVKVRFGSKAEMVSRPRHVRSSPQSRHSSARVARPLCANSGHRWLPGVVRTKRSSRVPLPSCLQAPQSARETPRSSFGYANRFYWNMLRVAARSCPVCRTLPNKRIRGLSRWSRRRLPSA